ncbi:FtsX-like permease family protein [Sanguibacter sp. HDW7]|uniref:FtsX-like permease family protein n=1 Tax=Sanguibacter sp. HDW7 TaxID=2714931 RepID=UPI00140E8DEA|nr:FtsX-like permease family protein [Sanguibacter sp. HDW7]QIK82261.1 hypothetical protein G7063_00460 [Sanguibacter sp. HDW7]
MRALGLWWFLRRRTTDARDPQRLSTVLAVVAFAFSTAALLVVAGGYGAFVDRAAAPGGSPDADQYPLLAGVASLLLLVPLTTLGGAAARLAVARRDERLATLRLAGATTGQVTTFTTLDAAAQALVGAVAGVALYCALLPAVALLNFQDRRFEIAELWVGVPLVLAAVGLVVVIALVSALASLRRVAVTPLGVAARTTPPGLRAVRALVLVAAVVAMPVVVNVPFGGDGVAIAMIVGVLVLGFAALGAIGPFVLQLVGRVTVRRARSVETLLAGRRIVDDPRTAWRSVGGVALATFIAGLASITALFTPPADADPWEIVFTADLRTGALLTLAIAGILAAVSTGVMQAGRAIDQREQSGALILAGSEPRTLDRARMRETTIPLAASVGLATATMLMLIAPVLGLGAFQQVSVVVELLAAIAAASALVGAGAWAAGLVARRTLPTP